MNLLQIRTQFVRTSGRYDLVVDDTDFADNGADFYIQAGQKHLDRNVLFQKAISRHVDMMAVGQPLVTFKEIRAIRDVWVAQDQIGRWELEKKDFRWLREQYPNLDTLENGDPTYYCPALLETVSPPETFDALMAYLNDIMGDDPSEYNGIIVLPPPDTATMIEVFGYAYKKALTTDTDSNYWSINHPELLVMAAQAVLEMSSRNTEGAKDWLNSIDTIAKGITFDLVDEEIADIDQMEG